MVYRVSLNSGTGEREGASALRTKVQYWLHFESSTAIQLAMRVLLVPYAAY